jgi:hypothetical protein
VAPPAAPRRPCPVEDSRTSNASPPITIVQWNVACLAALDVHPRVARQILRHAKITVTMEIYTEVPSAATRDALKKLGQWLGS